MARYILALVVIAIARLVMVQIAMAADTMLIVQRPGEPEFVKHRYPAMTACTVDLPSESYVQPKGTRLACVQVHERKEAKAR